MCKEVGAVFIPPEPEPQTMIGSTGIHRMTAVLTLRLPLSTYFGNANSSTRVLPRAHAGDIGVPSAGNAGLVVIQTHLSLGF
jgi:hypothetical protein